MKNKILIFDTVPYEMAPYISIYEDTCKTLGIEYDIFVWNRYGMNISSEKNNVYIFNKECSFGGSKLKKIIPMYLYQKELRRLIKVNKYDKMIAIDSLAPIMVYDILTKQYKEKFIMDIRDYTYENFPLYKKMMGNLIESSFITSLSSGGFKRFLGNSHKFVLTHNISNINSICKNIKPIREKPVIGFVGNIRYYDENKALVKSLDKNKFSFLYCGSINNDCHIYEFCKSNHFTNVHFSGIFQNNDKPRIYENIDIINSIYGTNSFEVTTAIPNRLYDALIYKKPILASKGTYLGELVEKYKIGLQVNVYKDDVNSILLDYIKNINYQELQGNMELLLNRVLNEQELYRMKIHEFVEK